METIIHVFNKNAKYYDSWYNTPLGRVVLEAEAQALEALLPPQGVGIDIGAGTGVFAQKLVDGREIVCLDPAEEMLKICSGRCIHRVAGIGEKLPFRDACFDFAYMVTVLEFISDLDRLMSEVKEVLKRDSTLSILIINRESSWGRTYDRVIREKSDPILALARLVDLEYVRNSAAKAGLRFVECIETLDFPPDTVPSGRVRLYRLGECLDCGVRVLKFIKP